MTTNLPAEAIGVTMSGIVERLGPIPLNRIVFDPVPGTGTVADVVRLDAENMLCELIDGVLVRKTMGFLELFLAARIGSLLTTFVLEHNLGVTAGEGGMVELPSRQIRIPDASFVSWERLQGSGFPDKPVPEMAPNLAVEVISRGNTRREMEDKLTEYFAAGVQLVWYVDPREKKVTVFTAADRMIRLSEQDTLDGGEVLPGLSIDLAALFALPTPPQA